MVEKQQDGKAIKIWYDEEGRAHTYIGGGLNPLEIISMLEYELARQRAILLVNMEKRVREEGMQKQEGIN